jgi:hypothetical protein
MRAGVPFGGKVVMKTSDYQGSENPARGHMLRDHVRGDIWITEIARRSPFSISIK